MGVIQQTEDIVAIMTFMWLSLGRMGMGEARVLPLDFLKTGIPS